MSCLPSASILNPSLVWSMGNGGEGRVKIQFPFAMDWYHEQPCTTFKALQHRKELRGFRHEFIVLQMTNGSICRIERMGDPDKRFNALSAKGSLAHDFAQMFPSRPDQAKEARLEASDIVAEINLPVEIDLKHVLYICRALHEGEKTRSYTLQVYNCYFLSLTLQCCLVRRSTRWDYSEFFNGWLSHLEKTTSQLQLPGVLPSIQHRNDTSFNPILLRVFSSLSMSDPEDPGVPQTIMKIIQDQLRHRFHPDAAFRQRLQDTLDNELWHSNISAIPHSFIEQEIEQIVLNTLRCALDTGCSKLEDATQVARWREWGDALIGLVSSASVCSKSKLIPSTSTRLPQTRSFSGINNNLTTAIKELDYRGTKAQSEDSELVQDLKNIHQWGSVCLVYFLQSCLWLLVIILSHWGIRLFNWGGAVPCIVIEDELDALLNMGPVDVTTLDSRIKDLRTLRKSKLAIWLKPPWADLHRTVEQCLVGGLQWMKSGPQEPTFDIKIQGQGKQPCSIQAFQSHILDRLEAQAELVESVWLGSAAEIKLELKDRLSEVWVLIREDLDPGEVEIQLQPPPTTYGGLISAVRSVFAQLGFVDEYEVYKPVGGLRRFSWHTSMRQRKPSIAESAFIEHHGSPAITAPGNPEASTPEAGLPLGTSAPVVATNPRRSIVGWHKLLSQDDAGTSHSLTGQTEQPNINTPTGPRGDRSRTVPTAINISGSLDRDQTEQPDSTPNHLAFSPPTVQVTSAQQWPTETQHQDASSMTDASLDWIGDTSHVPFGDPRSGSPSPSSKRRLPSPIVVYTPYYARPQGRDSDLQTSQTPLKQSISTLPVDIHANPEYGAYYSASPVPILTYGSTLGNTSGLRRKGAYDATQTGTYASRRDTYDTMQEDDYDPARRHGAATYVTHGQETGLTSTIRDLEDYNRDRIPRSIPAPFSSPATTVSVDGTLDSPYLCRDSTSLNSF